MSRNKKKTAFAVVHPVSLTQGTGCTGRRGFIKIFIARGISGVCGVLIAGRNASMAPQPPFTDDDVERIVDEYAKTVYKLACSQIGSRSDAEDVFQEVFLRYIRKQPAFENKAHEKAWFIRVTINCCRKMWASPFRSRKRSLEQEIPDTTSMEELDPNSVAQAGIIEAP